VLKAAGQGTDAIQDAVATAGEAREHKSGITWDEVTIAEHDKVISMPGAGNANSLLHYARVVTSNMFACRIAALARESLNPRRHFGPTREVI
jgi:hydroxymethylpyrimidine/phosphomethylpyrimidine kinase